MVRNAVWLFAAEGLSFLMQGVYFVVLERLLDTSFMGAICREF